MLFLNFFLVRYDGLEKRNLLGVKDANDAEDDVTHFARQVNELEADLCSDEIARDIFDGIERSLGDDLRREEQDGPDKVWL
jgi:hypothetical protein